MFARKGFTLIELLIVIAIIAILALIAVPNFLEAQTRAKVSRVYGDMRSLSTALESYRIDHSAFPLCIGRGGAVSSWGSGGISQVTMLTTPQQYITSVDLADPFVPNNTEHDEFGWVLGQQGLAYSIHYVNIRHWLDYNPNVPKNHWSEWVLASQGPDKRKGPDPTNRVSDWWVAYYADTSMDPTNGKFSAWKYSPTNGTTSNGDILMWQGANTE